SACCWTILTVNHSGQRPPIWLPSRHTHRLIEPGPGGTGFKEHTTQTDAHTHTQRTPPARVRCFIRPSSVTGGAQHKKQREKYRRQQRSFSSASSPPSCSHGAKDR
ncbi:unnamed protein product, partial [Pylaiella littoralis]